MTTPSVNPEILPIAYLLVRHKTARRGSVDTGLGKLHLVLLQADGHAERRRGRAIEFDVRDAFHGLFRVGIVPRSQVEANPVLELFRDVIIARPGDLAARDTLGCFVEPEIAYVLAVDDGNCLAAAVVVIQLVFADQRAVGDEDGIAFLAAAITRRMEDMELQAPGNSQVLGRYCRQ
jgi:hypothetical protein